MSSTAASVLKELPVLSDSKQNTPPQNQRIIIRPLCLADIPTLAISSVEAYWDDPVRHFLTPHAAKYRADFIRSSHQSIRQRLYNPRGLSLVACQASDPSVPVGYAQFKRLGDDEGAKAFLEERSLWARAWIIALSWFFWLYVLVENFIWPDRSCDLQAMKQFDASVASDSKIYWDSRPERTNRWHVQSVVIDPAWQGKGIGRLIVSKGVQRAQQERVIMGLSASPAGAHLYRKLGFEMLGNFTMVIGDEQGGGIMIRYPDGHDS